MKNQLICLKLGILFLFGGSSFAASLYVDLNCANPTPPYATWDTAATNIQDAVDAAADGDSIFVTNGIYSDGGKVVYGLLTNRVAIDKALTVQSVNGPAVTVIEGNGPIGDSAVRCVYLTNNATLIGFTFTNGATRSGGDWQTEQVGGGVWCEDMSGTISNCVIVNNSAIDMAGANSGTLQSCFISGNVAPDAYSGAGWATLYDCVLSNNYAGAIAGGAAQCTLSNCLLINNHCDASGGGAYKCTFTNCVLIGNSAGDAGGAATSTLVNCIVSSNLATNSGAGVENCTVQNSTITNNYSGDSGGGAQDCELDNCLVSNNVAVGQGGGADTCDLYGCTIVGNTAAIGGGASDSSTLYNCTLSGNQASTNGSGGGADNCTLNNCTLIGNSAQLGGGAAYCTLESCSLSGNTAVFGGGAAYSGLVACFVKTNSAISTVTGSVTVSNSIIFPGSGGGLYYGGATNCVIVGNSATNEGGGGYYTGCVNCTIVANSAFEGAGTFEPNLGGEVNCISYYNNGANSFPYLNGTYTCTFPLSFPSPDYVGGSISNEPLFVDLAGGDFHLQSNSPCINSGVNSYVGVATDMDGNPRIQGGTVDMGAYEYQTPGSVISYQWLEQYGLPLDGSVDFLDLDGTGMNNYQKWIAGLDPTNAASVLVMLNPGITPNLSHWDVSVSWVSVSNRFYDLERATNLAAQPAFSVIRSFSGGGGTNSYIDIVPARSGPYFYRVSVRR
jgi:hypothetical protein